MAYKEDIKNNSKTFFVPLTILNNRIAFMAAGLAVKIDTLRFSRTIPTTDTSTITMSKQYHLVTTTTTTTPVNVSYTNCQNQVDAWISIKQQLFSDWHLCLVLTGDLKFYLSYNTLLTSNLQEVWGSALTDWLRLTTLTSLYITLDVHKILYGLFNLYFLLWMI